MILFPYCEREHRVHDYKHLIRRWRTVARGAGLRLEEFARQGEYPVYCLHTKGDPGAGGLYVSAGIHGDEPAGAEGLACWAEAHLAAHVRGKAGVPLFIVPCLNPWGLVHNLRTDHKGRDLNRLFDKHISPIKELRRRLAGWRFDLSLHLHEDYDARGMYMYEVAPGKARWDAKLLAACASAAVPVENRRQIDGWAFRGGVLARPIPIEEVPMQPEALYLYLHHAPRSCTFETPSEFGLAQRVRAQVRLITKCLERLERTGRPEQPERPKQPATKKAVNRDLSGKLPRRAVRAAPHA